MPAVATLRTHCAYLWVDGNLKVRQQDKVCLPVMIGVRVDDARELVVLADEFRESSESRDARPVLAVSDGALGFRKALRGAFPDTTEQRDRRQKSGNVPRHCRSPPTPARRAPRRDLRRRGLRHDLAVAKEYSAAYGDRCLKAVAKITDDVGVLLAFCEYPPSTGSTC